MTFLSWTFCFSLLIHPCRPFALLPDYYSIQPVLCQHSSCLTKPAAKLPKIQDNKNHTTLISALPAIGAIVLSFSTPATFGAMAEAYFLVLFLAVSYYDLSVVIVCGVMTIMPNFIAMIFRPSPFFAMYSLSIWIFIWMVYLLAAVAAATKRFFSPKNVSMPRLLRHTFCRILLRIGLLFQHRCTMSTTNCSNRNFHHTVWTGLHRRRCRRFFFLCLQMGQFCGFGL